MPKSIEEGRADADADADADGSAAASISGGAVAGAEDASAIKGQLDPVYEAKARVLNRAVSRRWPHRRRPGRYPEPPMTGLGKLTAPNACRSRISVWAGTSGSSS